MNVEGLKELYGKAVANTDAAEGKVIRLRNDCLEAEKALDEARKAEERALLAYAQAVGIPEARLSIWALRGAA